jgi:hypothetical protein
MTYAPETDPLTVVLDLGQPYAPTLDPLAVDFDLAAVDTGFVFRKPPLAITYGHRSEQASLEGVGAWTLDFKEAPEKNPPGREHQTNQARALTLPGYAKPWNRVAPKDDRDRIHQGDNADPLRLRAEAVAWNQNTPRDRFGIQPWGAPDPKDQNELQGFNVPPTHDVATRLSASDSVLNWQPPPPVAVETEQGDTLNLLFSPYTPPGFAAVDFELVPEALLVVVVPPTRSVDAQQNTPAWSLKAALDGRTIHPWDRKPRLGTEVEFPSAAEPNAPIDEGPAEPENKRTYLIMNASSLIEVTSGLPLDFKDLSIALDADSFAWTMSATILNRASMDQIRPGADGPAEVEATINGHIWRFVIESYRLDRSFARETYKVSGASRTQLLAAPYAPRTTGRIESQLNAYQVMSQRLQFTGFSVTRQAGLSDYIIPADAWGWDDKTAMEVIAELAAAQGAIVVPDKETDELHIRHRYKLAGPWIYDDQPITFVDAILQDTMIVSYASQWEPNPDYNAVFVSGITAGVATDVTVQGTAGDKPAPDIFDDLNVEAFQCRERGMTAIAAGGNQEIVTIDTVLPTSGSPGLIEPGMVIEYRDTQTPANTWRGNVLSTSITLGKPGTGKVIQTLKVERHHYGNG